MKDDWSVLVTGGAGFIGTALLPLLTPLVRTVTVFDNLLEQVHGPDTSLPADRENVRYVLGDVRDQDAVRAVVERSAPNLIVHLAAETGTGQSHDEVSRYCAVNVQGTAHLIEALRSLPEAPRRLVLASSRAVYGEGAYRDGNGGLIVPGPRDPSAMAARSFVPSGPDGSPLQPVATSEDVAPMPGSIYAVTKLVQEQLLGLGLGDAIDVVTLRFQNVYGAGQSLRNPYTGVLSIFGALILKGERLNIYEDGEIVRDFVHVRDVAAAIAAAAKVDVAPCEPINIGSGAPTTIIAAARALLRELGRPEDALFVSGDFRTGDIRHAVADIARARRLLDWSPAVSFEDGIAELAEWIRATTP